MAERAEIHVSPEEVSRLRLAFMRVSRRMRQQTGGLTQSQLSALASVDRDGPLSITDLAALEQVTVPSISRIVTILENGGYVARGIVREDARISTVLVTKEGQHELKRLRADRDAWLRRRIAELSPADQKKVAAALPALEKLLEAAERSPEARKS